MCDDTIDPSLSPSHKQLLSNPLATVTMHKRPVKLSAESNMPKRCAYGTWKSDSRYPRSLEGGVEFFPLQAQDATRKMPGVYKAVWKTTRTAESPFKISKC